MRFQTIKKDVEFRKNFGNFSFRLQFAIEKASNELDEQKKKPVELEQQRDSLIAKNREMSSMQNKLETAKITAEKANAVQFMYIYIAQIPFITFRFTKIHWC